MKFDNYRSFFDAIKDADHTEHENLSLFCQLTTIINVGCGCSRSKREQAAINNYKTIPSQLTDTEITYLKDNFDNVIEFFHEHEYIGKI